MSTGHALSIHKLVVYIYFARELGLVVLHDLEGESDRLSSFINTAMAYMSSHPLEIAIDVSEKRADRLGQQFMVVDLSG